MGDIIDEMKAVLDGADPNTLVHYGTPRHSGRYPWGSGKDPYQHTRNLLSRINELKANGWTETPENIMSEFGLTTTQYRAQKGLANDLERMDRLSMAKSLKADGLGSTEIARKMSERLGYPVSESSVRSLLDAEAEKRTMQAKNTADFIRERIKQDGIIDIGAGTEIDLNISKEKLNQAIEILKSEGYKVQTGGLPQVTNVGQQTITKVIGPPDMKPSDFYNFQTGEVNIHSLHEYISRDGGDSYEKKFHYPTSVDSSRVKILLADEKGPDGATGIERDGLIFLRPGCPDLSLGDSHYAQVRILVDGNKYLKGMAVYKDDLPEGIDIMFNSNKHKVEDGYKKIKDDPENPFGSAIKDASQGGQYWYTDPKTGERKLGAINKRADEGDWSDWADKLPAQFLSKQPLPLAKQQLKLAIDAKQEEYDSIMAINNPTIKKHFLDKFASECDSAAVHLSAAALPGQKYNVILPLKNIKTDECYAPGYPDGTTLALVRYPHGGTFEIPIVTVNNKNKEGRSILGTEPSDAICINSKVAERLSGADFDGDTVMCIPTGKNGVNINSTKALPELDGFDSKSYKIPEGDTTTKRMKNTQTEMGIISNLITDMTLQGADRKELARAVKHSMVVIDAEKHGLDYKQSEIDNGIAALKKLYQPNGGAETLISKAKGRQEVVKRQGSPIINIKGSPDYDPSKPEGSLIYKEADNAHYLKKHVNKKTGEVTYTEETRTQRSTKMAETDDARTLISKKNTPMEREYANFANTMKGMANKARVELTNTGKIAYSAKAKAAYKAEVDSLMAKLREAERNRPKERQALVMANAKVAASTAAVRNKLKAENPGISDKDLDKLVRKNFDVRKASQKALTNARHEVGSVSRRDRSIDITDREWEAIQAGAISESYLTRILNNSDVDKLRQRATPRKTQTITTSQISKINSLKNSDYTIAEIAEACGLSVTTVSKYLKGET